MENNENKNNNVQNVESKNWKSVAMNWGKRVLWAGIGAGITIGVQALRNRRKSHQQQ